MATPEPWTYTGLSAAWIWAHAPGPTHRLAASHVMCINSIRVVQYCTFEVRLFITKPFPEISLPGISPLTNTPKHRSHPEPA